jgi:hypothetical protein
MIKLRRSGHVARITEKKNLSENQNKTDNLKDPGKDGRITKTHKNRKEDMTSSTFKYQNTRVPGGVWPNVVKLPGM